MANSKLQTSNFKSDSPLRFGVWSWKLTLIAALLASGCSAAPSGPPEILVDRTACAHCGMLISELVYAAAYQAAGAEARVFDDIGCLRNAAHKETGPLTAWFHDADSREWIEGATTVFVTSPEIRSPMGGGLIAYRDRTAAERAAEVRHGRVIHTVADMLSDTEGGK
jgi:copper chaperone NosL